MKNYMTLKELANKYTNEQILEETWKTYGLYSEDLCSFLKLFTTIRNAAIDECDKQTIDFFVILPKRKADFKVVPFAGFAKNNRIYKFTSKNTKNINEIAGCKVAIPEDNGDDDVVIIHTELQWFICALLSLNAFSPEVVEAYFNGDFSAANSKDYIINLIKNKKYEDSLFG